MFEKLAGISKTQAYVGARITDRINAIIDTKNKQKIWKFIKEYHERCARKYKTTGNARNGRTNVLTTKETMEKEMTEKKQVRTLTF